MSGYMPDMLRAVADVIEDGVRYGLPEPQTVTIGRHSGPTLILKEFADVEAWAEYLQTPFEVYESGDCEHISATADLSDVYGISVRVTTNRPLEAQVTA